MHGKILRYSNQTKNGVIINATKKIFELRSKNWHDKRVMPSAGLLVEFRLDDEDGNGSRVTSCKASKYQAFPEGGLIREIDFWRTNTDDELKSKEIDAKGNIAKKIFEETDYFKLSSIEISTPIQDTIKEYFKEEFNALTSIKGMEENTDSEDEHQKRINYTIVKPYLTKAIDYLVFNDRHITIDVFADNLQVLTKLEYSYKQFQTNVNLTADKIYQECFLDAQYHYKGVLRAIESFNEKKLSMQNKIRVGAMELRSIQAKIDAKKGDPAVLEEKKKRTMSIVAKAEADIKVLTEVHERLKGLADGFKKDNLKKFESVFNKMYEILIGKTKDAMDVCATHIDNKLWQLGMSSLAIKNVFFKHNINSPFCAMTFLGNHVKMLDKSKLRDNEYVVYQHYNKYVQKNMKNFLIFSDNPDFCLELKVKIMTKSKFYNVVPFHKEIEYFSAVNRQKYELIYIDSELRFGTPAGIIKIGKESKRNKETNFAILSMAQIKTFDPQ
ncbi:hypothetical protein [Helicobacter typhlonius]|uniref:Uncharacterized protein n=2 Tax=Helicobacter typhlonius TaxID=76936 RepID=A0A099UHJ8_9HELI|nr:hypothetical protein [Helicobacter typhlonius]TLD79070.1 hypothetical protein LS75_001820 [Helicobacter typhlonius]CUU40379.1 FIG00712888: Hypothetical protein [Helicobacter typhlonius]